MLKTNLKKPLILGISWFFFAFLSSELSYRSANHLFDYSDNLAGYLYKFSESIAWPASVLYTIRHKQIIEENINTHNSENASSNIFMDVSDDIGNLDENELWEISEQLDFLGYKSNLNTTDEYMIYILSCALSGLGLAILGGIFINLFFPNKEQRGAGMDILNSNKVKNRIKARSVIIAVVLHAFLGVMTLGVSLLLLLVTGLITSAFLQKELNELASGSNKFKKNFPFKYYGEVFGNFQHIFSHEKVLENDMYAAIESEVKIKTPIDAFTPITITDIDNDLISAEDRTFIKAESGQTSRGTSITLILDQSSFGNMQSIQWQVLAGGYVDRDKKFNLITYSLFSLVFWIVPYLKREHDLLARVRTIYPGSYNDMDVITQIRCIHEAVFDAMINELEANEVDTSNLKAQKMQTMNINISGGKVNMGNIVQGAMNKVSNIAKGSKS